MHFIKTTLFSSLLMAATTTQAQVYDYDYGKGTDHVGIVADINQNLGYNMIESAGTKSAFAPFARIGGYIKHQFSPRFYLRGALMVGNGNYSYNYTKTFEPTSDTTYPIGIMGKHAISLPVIEPELGFGYLFRIKKQHQLDVRLSASAVVYLSQYNNYSDTTFTDVNLNGERVRYGTSARFRSNREDNQWGVINGNLYLGYKKVHHNDVSDRLGIGLIFGVTVLPDNAAQAEFYSHNMTYNYTFNPKVHKLGYCSIGIRIEYDIF